MSGQKRKPVVVFISHWAKSLGGAEYSLIDIARQVALQAHTHFITSEEGCLVDTMRRHGSTCHVIGAQPSLMKVKRGNLLRDLLVNIPALLAFLRYLYTVRSLLAALHPDCIHANVPKSHISLLLLHICGVRCRGIIHFREIFDRGSPAYTVYRVLYSLAGRPEVIAISRAVQNALPPTMHQQSIVLYNGITVPPPQTKQEQHLPIQFLYLGRVVPWKGCDFLIESFIRMMNNSSEVQAHLSIIGDTSYWESSYRDHLLTRIKNSGTDTVITLQGHSDDVSGILAQHDILCLPSRSEPFGRAAAEAQGAGRAVIAWNSGALREIIEHRETGLLTPVDDLEAFADAMQYFIDNPHEMTRMGENGRKRTETFFNRDRQIPLIADYIVTPHNE